MAWQLLSKPQRLLGPLMKINETRTDMYVTCYRYVHMEYDTATELHSDWQRHDLVKQRRMKARGPWGVVSWCEVTMRATPENFVHVDYEIRYLDCIPGISDFSNWGLQPQLSPWSCETKFSSLSVYFTENYEYCIIMNTA